ncbi:hypothetical protein ACJX0J_017221, partial [Zea mays]
NRNDYFRDKDIKYSKNTVLHFSIDIMMKKKVQIADECLICYIAKCVDIQVILHGYDIVGYEIVAILNKMTFFFYVGIMIVLASVCWDANHASVCTLTQISSIFLLQKGGKIVAHLFFPWVADATFSYRIERVGQGCIVTIYFMLLVANE